MLLTIDVGNTNMVFSIFDGEELKGSFRLTTVAADEILEESGVARKDRKKVIDRVAAGIILQSYLDWQKRQEAAQNGGTNEGR